MLNKIIKFIYNKRVSPIYTGKGFLQGMGFDLECTKVRILGVEFVQSIKISVDGEWMRKLKTRMEEDKKQQEKEIV